MKPNSTFALLASVSGGSVNIGNKGKWSARVYNSCPDTVFLASGDQAVVPTESERGSCPLGPNESETFTFTGPIVSGIVHSLGGLVYITPADCSKP